MQGKLTEEEQANHARDDRQLIRENLTLVGLLLRNRPRTGSI